MKPFLFLLLALLPAALIVSAAEAKPPKPAKITIAVVPGALRFATTRFDATAG